MTVRIRMQIHRWLILAAAVLVLTSGMAAIIALDNVTGRVTAESPVFESGVSDVSAEP